jgi:hypothetical protein
MVELTTGESTLFDFSPTVWAASFERQNEAAFLFLSHRYFPC